jgi:hypothetical protein
VKQHLQKYFTRAVEHHLQKAKHHAAMSTHFGKLATMHKAKSDMQDTAALYQSISDAHSEMNDEHAGMGEHCAECAKAFTASHKAAGMGGDVDLDALEPLPAGLSRVTPTAPGVRAVIRTGQREISATVAPVFEKIYGDVAERSDQ